MEETSPCITCSSGKIWVPTGTLNFGFLDVGDVKGIEAFLHCRKRSLLKLRNQIYDKWKTYHG